MNLSKEILDLVEQLYRENACIGFFGSPCVPYPSWLISFEGKMREREVRKSSPKWKSVHKQAPLSRGGYRIRAHKNPKKLLQHSNTLERRVTCDAFTWWASRHSNRKTLLDSNSLPKYSLFSALSGWTIFSQSTSKFGSTSWHYMQRAYWTRRACY